MGAQGTTTVDFGAFAAPSPNSPAGHPNTESAVATVTGQAGIVAGSAVEAWIRPVASADHSADEHLFEDLRIVAYNIVAATGFDIKAECLTGGAYGVYNVNWVWN